MIWGKNEMILRTIHQHLHITRVSNTNMIYRREIWQITKLFASRCRSQVLSPFVVVVVVVIRNQFCESQRHNTKYICDCVMESRNWKLIQGYPCTYMFLIQLQRRENGKSFCVWMSVQHNKYSIHGIRDFLPPAIFLRQAVCLSMH